MTHELDGLTFLYQEFTQMPNNTSAEPLADDGAAPQAEISVADAQARLVETQMRVARAIERQGECRGLVAAALAVFQRVASQTVTQEQLIRQHLESENELRRLRAEGKLPQRGSQRRLGSAIDAYAYHTRNSGRGAGGGAAFRRGATSASGRSMLGAAPKAFPGSGLPQVKE
jgi:hypothetical protein